MGVPGDASFLKEHIRDIPDFPRSGIVFKDISPLLADPAAFRFTVDALTSAFADRDVEAVVGVEARGFVVGAPVAYHAGLPFVPVRKPGKLPGAVERVDYALEYGVDTLEMQREVLAHGARVVVVDDVLATGGTAAAVVRLIEQLGAVVVGIGVVIELAFLDGRKQLPGRDVVSLITYE